MTALGTFRIERTITISTGTASASIITTEQIGGVYDSTNLRQAIDEANPYGHHPLVYEPDDSTRITIGIYIEGDGFWLLMSPADYRRLISG